MSTIDRLLDEASKKYGVDPNFLRRVLNLERIHLYLVVESRQSVRNRIRKLVQEVAENDASKNRDEKL